MNSKKELESVLVIFMEYISPQTILERTKNEDVGEFEGLCEFDDVLFNLHGEYTFPVTYYTNEKRKTLMGFEIDIPIEKFNTYVRLKDLWLRDYKGSGSIVLYEETQSS